jgi:C_GCAxxG_C_C family probable redox protein
MRNSKVDQAVEYFKGHYSCSQAMMLTYAPHLGLDAEIALQLGTGFAGGMGRHGEVCGAVTGAVMVIGLKYGMKNKDDEDARAKTFELVSELFKRFSANHNSVRCRTILGCDISTPEGRELAKTENRFKTLCPEFVRTAAEFLEDII